MRLAGAGVQAVRGGVGQPFLAKLAASAAISPFRACFALSSDSKSESSTYLVVFFFFLSDRKLSEIFSWPISFRFLGRPNVELWGVDKLGSKLSRSESVSIRSMIFSFLVKSDFVAMVCSTRKLESCQEEMGMGIVSSTSVLFLFGKNYSYVLGNSNYWYPEHILFLLWENPNMFCFCSEAETTKRTYHL